MHFSLHLILEASLENSFVGLTPSMMHVVVFCDIRSPMVSKHSELMKWQIQDGYGRFASPSSRTTPPPLHHKVESSSHRRSAPHLSCMQEVGSSSRRRTAPPPSHQEEASSDDLVEMWVVAPPPPLRLQVDPPPPTRLGDSSLTFSGYNDECPHIREVSSYKHCF
jgi:hypothetical protein